MDRGEGEDTKECQGEGCGAAAEVGKWEDFKEFMFEERDLKCGRLERGGDQGCTANIFFLLQRELLTKLQIYGKSGFGFWSGFWVTAFFFLVTESHTLTLNRC